MVGKVLKYMRIKRNLKQNELARLVNLDQTTLSKYELEKRDITFKTLESVAKTCDFEVIIKDLKTNQEFKLSDLERKDI